MREKKYAILAILSFQSFDEVFNVTWGRLIYSHPRRNISPVQVEPPQRGVVRTNTEVS